MPEGTIRRELGRPVTSYERVSTGTSAEFQTPHGTILTVDDTRDAANPRLSDSASITYEEPSGRRSTTVIKSQILHDVLPDNEGPVLYMHLEQDPTLKIKLS